MAANQKGMLNESVDLVMQVGERHLPERVLKWVALAAVDFAFLVGAEKLVPHTVVLEVPLTTILAIILAILFVMAIASGLWHRRVTTVQAPVLKAKVVIGCRIGRRSVDCGAVKAERNSIRGNMFRLTTIGQPYRSPPNECLVVKYDKNQLIQEAVQAIGAIAEQILAYGLPSADAITIAVPGTVEVEGNEIVTTELPTCPNLVEAICDGLRDDQRVHPWIEELFSVDLEVHPSPLVERIFLDNDVRSAARYHLLVGHWHRPRVPRNTILVNIGLGMRAGLALGGSVYYGRHSAAGNVVCGSGYTPDERNDIGRICGIEGLQEISFGMNDKAVLNNKLREFCASHHRHAGTPDQHDAKACQDLFARDPEHGLLNFITGAPSSDPSDPSDPLRTAILEQYSDRLSGILASLASTVDPDEIVLYGGVADKLSAIPGFMDGLNRKITRLLDRQVRLENDAQVDWEWLGCALLAWDKSYWQKRSQV